MKINVSIEIDPFPIPKEVFIKKSGLRQDGFVDRQSIPLNELSVEVVESLCADFRKRILDARSTYVAQYIRSEDPT